jgi:lipopolysaccharide transport system ATP-binding protein
MGMTKAEIRSKFDEIVEFAGVAKYVDTPVKRYSSGMMVRLGFAIAAHLEPEILVVDEVLAVGDAAFQEKCNNYFKSLKNKQTIILVTHDMENVKRFCDRAILLEDGKIIKDGKPDEVADAYLKLFN